MMNADVNTNSQYFLSDQPSLIHDQNPSLLSELASLLNIHQLTLREALEQKLGSKRAMILDRTCAYAKTSRYSPGVLKVSASYLSNLISESFKKSFAPIHGLITVSRRWVSETWRYLARLNLIEMIGDDRCVKAIRVNLRAIAVFLFGELYVSNKLPSGEVTSTAYIEESTKLNNNLLKTTKEENNKTKEEEQKMCDDGPVEESKYRETYYGLEIIQKTYTAGDEKQANDTFELFWELYPLKKDKRMARNIWLQQGCYTMFGRIIPKLAQQVKEDVKFLTGYVPTPTNYLRGWRWEDEIERPKTKAKYNHTDTSWVHKTGLLR